MSAPQILRPARRAGLTSAALSAALLLASALLSGCSTGDSPQGAAAPGDPARSSAAGTPPSSAPVRLSEVEESLDLPEVTPGEPLGADLVSSTPRERKAWVAGNRAFLGEVTRVLKNPAPTTPSAGPTEFAGVTGPAAEELRNTWDEYALNGWAVRGQARVLSSQVVHRSENPASVVLRVCLDNSDVSVVDSEGAPVPNSAPSSPRTLNLVTLVEQDAVWVVSEQRPASSPDC